jgi:hypothetical protein
MFDLSWMSQGCRRAPHVWALAWQGQITSVLLNLVRAGAYDRRAGESSQLCVEFDFSRLIDCVREADADWIMYGILSVDHVLVGSSNHARVL